MKMWVNIFREIRSLHGPWPAGLLMLATGSLVILPATSPLLLVGSCLVLLLVHGVRSGRMGAGEAIRSPLFWMAVLYLLYAVGLLWSSNMDYAAFDLEVKASMLVFPLVVLLLPRKGRVGGEALLSAFTQTCAWAVTICVGVALWRYGDHLVGYLLGTRTPATTAYFISSSFSLFLHPSYFAMYLCMALFQIELAPGNRPLSTTSTRAALIVGIVLCASKAGWLVMVGWWVLSLMLRWNDRPARHRAIGALVGTGCLLGALVLASPFFQEKVGQFGNAAKGGTVDVSASGSTESRELIWSAALPLIGEHAPWGTGTGDVKDVLLERYARKGFTHAVEQRLNAHSQWLQTTLTLGVPGLLLLLGLLFVPGLAAMRTRDHLMLAFLGLLAVNWAVESMLETQAGVLFLSWTALMLAMRSSRP